MIESIVQIEKPFNMSVKDIFLYILTNYFGMFFNVSPHNTRGSGHWRDAGNCEELPVGIGAGLKMGGI